MDFAPLCTGLGTIRGFSTITIDSFRLLSMITRIWKHGLQHFHSHKSYETRFTYVYYDEPGDFTHIALLGITDTLYYNSID